MNRLKELVQQERDGVLVGRDRQLLDEARKRGLVPTPKDPVSEGMRELAGVNAALVAEIVKVIGKQKPPVVNMPEVRVNVPETSVNVEAVIPQQMRPRLKVEIERDRDGNIKTMYIEPAE